MGLLDHSSLSLLIVDDTKLMREMVASQLQQCGYVVTTAENGQQALQMMVAERFDLVLLDIEMPLMDGYETLAAIKARDGLQDTPVIMLTAINNTESVVKCINLGAADYIAKPINQLILRSRVGKVLLAHNGDQQHEDALKRRQRNAANILLVDESQAVRDLLSKRVSEFGHLPLVAEGGEEALVIMQDMDVDLMLLDLEMVNTSAPALLKKLKANEDWAKTPVIVIAADAGSDEVKQCMELGADDYLSKPFKTLILRRRLESVLCLHQDLHGLMASVEAKEKKKEAGEEAVRIGR
jgi:DNA-binding response OmpR family regulator